MSVDSIQLAYVYSLEDRARDLFTLETLLFRKKDLTAYFLLRTPWPSLMLALASLIVAVGLIFLLQDLFRTGRGFRDLVTGINTLAMAVLLFVTIQATLASWAGYRNPDLAQAEGREGIRWGRRELIATREDLTVRLSSTTSVYRWPAFIGLKRTRHSVFLMVTPLGMFPVPNHAFGSKAELDQFCDFVGECIAHSSVAADGQSATA